MVNYRLKKVILEVVASQIRENHPPEVRLALDRLLAGGYSRKTAKEMIGSALVEEIWSALHDKQQVYNDERSCAALSKLS